MINIVTHNVKWIPETVAISAGEIRGFTIDGWRYVGKYPRMMKLKLLLIKIMGISLAVLLLSTSIYAQTGVDSYDLQFYNPGATMPFQNYPFDSSEVQCNQPAPIITTGNPTKIFWDDTDNIGMVCIHTPSSGPLFSLPNGNYEGTLIAINQFGSSGESNRSPFSRGTAPGALSGFGFAE